MNIVPNQEIGARGLGGLRSLGTVRSACGKRDEVVSMRPG